MKMDKLTYLPRITYSIHRANPHLSHLTTMESTLSPAASSLLSKTLKTNPSSLFSLLHFRRISTSTHPSTVPHSLTTRLLTRRLAASVDLSISTPFASIRVNCAAFPPNRCFSRSVASFAAGGGGGGSGVSGGGGDDGSGNGGSKLGGGIGAVDDVSALSPDAIMLDVGGMTCGGCAAKVKKILENQPQVSSASVNLATETAVVWPISEAKVVPNWRQELGEMLAKHLTNCGFETNLRGQGDEEGESPS